MSDSKAQDFSQYLVSLRRSEVESNVLRINQDINGGSAALWLQELAVIERAAPQEVTVKISSPGGSVYHCMGLYDALRRMSANGVKIRGEVEGWAASAAAILLQACDYRVAGPSARILVHEVRGAIGYGRGSDIEDEAAEMTAISDWMLDILHQRTGDEPEEWQKRTRRRERWFSAQEAKELNLIDEIR